MKKTIGIIGLGSIGMRHAKNLRDLGHHVIGFDPIMAKHNMVTEVFTNQWPIEKLNELDGIVIASPTPLHEEHLKLADKAEKPIFVEKPVAHTADIPMGNVVMVGYNLRFHPCVQQAAQWIGEGMIGMPTWANLTLAQYSEKPPYLRDGVILNWSHEIDLAIHLLGRAKISASSTRLVPYPDYQDHDDMTDILMEHEFGCRSTIHLDYTTRPEVRQTIIVGPDGTIIFDLVNHRAWLREPAMGQIVSSLECKEDTWDRTYIDEMQEFLNRIDGKFGGGCTVYEGLDVLKICLKVRKQAGLS